MTTEIVTGLNPEGKKLLRIEARNAEVPIEKKPEWINTKLNRSWQDERCQTARAARRSGDGVPSRRARWSRGSP